MPTPTPTTVVNKKHESYDIYGGRPSILGNPFHIGRDGTRAEVIEKHRLYAKKRFDNDPEFRAAVLACKGKVLGCWCKPLPCHLDYIAELADGENK